MSSADDLVEDLSEAGLTSKWGERGDPKWVRIWVRDRWSCVYCNEGLLNHLIGMFSAQVDHLLPKSRYPEYADTEANYVLSCYCCNQIKRDFDPLNVRPELKEAALDMCRDALIEVCRQYIDERLEKKRKILKESRAIVDRYLAPHS